MSGFIYYVPGRQKASLEELADVGLGHAFDSPPVCRAVIQGGPDGGTGCVVVDGASDKAIARYDVTSQAWAPAPVTTAGDDPPYWVGYVTDSPPQPGDLARKDQLDGKVMTFASGHRWHVPRLREWRVDDEWPSWSSSVPRSVDVDELGRWVYGEVLGRYRELWDWSCRAAGLYAEEVQTSGRATIRSDADSCDFALCCLQANYRLGRRELAMMGFSAESDAVPVVRYALDVDGLRDHLGNHLRRLESETIDTSCGAERPTADEPTNTPTDQRSPS